MRCTRFVALAGLAAAGLALAGCARQSGNVGDTALADRIAIEDLLVKYYSHFGGTENEDFGAYYTEDAVFDVNGQVATGRKAIVAIYDGMDEGASPEPQGVFRMLLTNAQITVTGDTATAKLYWTGVINDDPYAPPKLREQGREYDALVKVDGKWLIKKRVVIADSGMPESFRATYSPRLDYDITRESDR